MKVESIFDKGSGKINEDALVLNAPVFGVFDGATSLVSYDEDGKTGAYLAAHIACEVFTNTKKPLLDLAHDANKKLLGEMESKNIDVSKKENLWGTTASVIRLGKNQFEYLLIGDSAILIIYTDNSYKLAVDYNDHDMELLTKWKKFADMKTKNILHVLDSECIELRKISNVSYGVMNGEKEAVKFLHTGTESLHNVKHVLLFTDGLLIPKENPQNAPQFDALVKLYLEGGLAKVKNQVRELENNDPNCWKYPRFKQHDDIAAIAISL